MRQAYPFLVVATSLLLGVMPSRAAPLSGLEADDWAVVSSERYGFSITYPPSVFTPANRATLEDGELLESSDGRARLLIGTFHNDGGFSLQDYRRIVLERSYPGAQLDYAPVRDSWFVVSGVRDEEMFYERVSFTCGGKRITSWAMTYPVAERRLYDRIVEAVAPTFEPSRRGEGC